MILGLKQVGKIICVGIKIYAGFEAGGMRELNYKSCKAKIIYLGIEEGKKYGLPMQGLKPVRKIDYAKV